jgi:hypothetical protein
MPTFRYVLSSVRLGTITVQGSRPLARLMLRLASFDLKYSPYFLLLWLSRTFVLAL